MNAEFAWLAAVSGIIAPVGICFPEIPHEILSCSNFDPDKRRPFMADSQGPWGLAALGGAGTEPDWRTKPSWDLVSGYMTGGADIRITNADLEPKERPIQTIMAAIADFIIAVISSGGHLGIAGLMVSEFACIPLLSEIIMPFAGYLVSIGRFNLPLLATAGAIGRNLGSAIAYEIGARGGRPVVERWGSWVLLDPDELDRMQRYFTRFGDITVLVCRLLPVVRTFIALPAGIARMPRLRFHLYTFVGSWP
jgi:membrane protein DedA with SNARE-associated domain